MFDKQEAFNKSYTGLASQNFKRCVIDRDVISNCVYTKINDDGTINHCAWGWVDLDIPVDFIGGIDQLRIQNIGIAAKLAGSDISFARDLQEAHDSFKTDDIKYQMEEVAKKYNLIVPELV